MPVLLVGGAALVAWFAFEGFRQGVVRRAVEVLGFVAMFLLASTLAERAQPWIDRHTLLDGEGAFYGAWALVLVGGLLLIHISARAISRMVQVSVVGWLDRTGGLLLGAAFGVLSLSCLLVALLALPLSPEFEERVRDHEALGPALQAAPAIYDWVATNVDGESFFEAVREGGEAARDAARRVGEAQP